MLIELKVKGEFVVEINTLVDKMFSLFIANKKSDGTDMIYHFFLQNKYFVNYEIKFPFCGLFRDSIKYQSKVIPSGMANQSSI